MNKITVQTTENSCQISISTTEIPSPFEILRDEVRRDTNIAAYIALGYSTVELRLPYVQKELEECLAKFSDVSLDELKVCIVSTDGLPDFIVKSCLKKMLTVEDLPLLNEMILECHGMEAFDLARWERQATVLGVDNLADLTTVFDSSLLLCYFPDLAKLGNFLARTIGNPQKNPYTYLQNNKGVLLYTAGDPEMIELMERKALG